MYVVHVKTMTRLRIAGLIVNHVSHTHIIALIEEAVIRKRFPPKCLYNQEVLLVTPSRSKSSMNARVTIQTRNFKVELKNRNWSIIQRLHTHVNPITTTTTMTCQTNNTSQATQINLVIQRRVLRESRSRVSIPHMVLY